MKNIKPIYYLIAVIGALVVTTPVWADHPTRRQMARVGTLAHQLEDAVHHVHAAAERTAHHKTRAESHALLKLHELDNQARHFHRQVERHHQNPYHTEADFEELFDAFYEAKHTMRYLHAFGHVRDDFARVEQLMFRLGDYYGRRPHWRGQKDQHWNGGGPWRRWRW